MGELARMRLRGQGCCQRARHTAIRTLLVRAIVSQRRWSNFTGLALSDACGASSPKVGALGKEVSFSMKLICVCWKTSRNAKASPDRRGGIERSEDDGEVSSPQKQIPHTGRLRCGGAGMESENVFNRFCHRRQRCGSCHRRCRCTAPDRGRCAPRPPHRWGRGLQWQKPCSGSRCRPCR